MKRLTQATHQIVVALTDWPPKGSSNYTKNKNSQWREVKKYGLRAQVINQDDATEVRLRGPKSAIETYLKEVYCKDDPKDLEFQLSYIEEIKTVTLRLP